MTNQQMIRLIKRHENAVAKERDALDADIEQLEMLKESCEGAHDALITARDYLSELV